MFTAAASSSFRAWAFVVLVLDIGLVFGRDYIPRFVIPLTLMYLAAESAEGALRFGLYEVGLWGTGISSSFCNCATPPCSASIDRSFLNFMGVCTVFLVDFYFTRGFAHGMELQLRSIEASVAVSKKVAAALARYDVEAAGSAIQEGTDLPEELAESYKRLLSNLMLYRDYLPDSLLDASGTDASGGNVAPPMGDAGGEVNAGIVFTDIQSSTALWEEYPQEMYDGLRVHNNTLRGVAKEHEGYEVKIIGDALMLAFG
eukprot:Hpha_TRINITY_DN16071_c3_g7::TRINITY_DN16071_c3_g7_i1::g.121013::m.121013